MRPPARPRLLAGLLAALFCASEPAAAQPGGVPASNPEERALRGLLQDARALLRQDRAEIAEQTLRRGLAFAPDDARLHRLLARALEEQGQTSAAAEHVRRADALDPPPPPLPAEPLEETARGLAVALVPPGPSEEPPSRVPADWPEGIAAQTLVARLTLRLPGAEVAFASPQSVAEAREWLAERAPRGVLSLRVDRAYCADTLKDGFFAVAQLRVAGELPGQASEGPALRRELIPDPRSATGCEAEALARALERAFELEGVRRVLGAPDRPDPPAADAAIAWSTQAIRALFPGIGERLEAELTEGRSRLAAGRIAAAAESFRRAVQIDPTDPPAQSYLAEAEATLAMAAEIARQYGRAAVADEDRGVLDPRFSVSQREAAEARLADEHRQRAELLTVREVLRSGTRAPPPEALAGLRSALVGDSPLFGPAAARRLAGGAVGAREAVAPDGGVMARYYVGPGGAVVLEEGFGADGRPNRWVAYGEDGSRTDLWEDGHGSGSPDVHFGFAPGGEEVARVESDTDRDGAVDRILDYADGAVSTESRDTDGDGALDRFDRFDGGGFVATRDEDLDGDGAIDSRTTYRAGRLVERVSW